MAAKTDYLFKALYILSWIIFIGVCIEAGAFISNTFFMLFYSPAIASKMWTEVNLSALYNYNESYFVILTSLMIIVAVLRAIMFYIIVKMFHDKAINLSRPFNDNVKQFILSVAYLAIGISIFSFWGAKFTQGLARQGVNIPDIHYLRLGGADVWLFMGVALLIIARIFKNGIDIQNELDLTV